MMATTTAATGTTLAMLTALPRSANGGITTITRMPAHPTASMAQAGSSVASSSAPVRGTTDIGVADIGAAATGIPDSTGGVTATDAAMDTAAVATDTAAESAIAGVQ